MIFERVRSDGLGHISYVVGSGHEGAVIDPRRDCDEYLEIAREHDIRIRSIFETHRNEDYTTGSVELAHLTGATIRHGSALDFRFGEKVEDGDEFPVGDLVLGALHTPGHTDESMSYVLSDPSEGGQPIMVFTGDALFVGDVGRTDLYGPEEAPRLAQNLYDSIFGKILPLGDGVILCPAHGSGSVCGGSISQREESTLGLERKLNPMLGMEEEEFVERKSTESFPRPPYFRMMEKLNLEGPPLLGELPNPGPLEPAEFRAMMEEGAVVVDTRLPPSYGGAHIRDSLSIWMGGLPMIAGWVLPYDRPIILVLMNRDHMDMATRYLVRLGYDKIGGYLCSGIEACGLEAWYAAAQPMDRMELLSVQELKGILDGGDGVVVLDVREEPGWESGHIPGAMHIYSGHVRDNLEKLPREGRIVTVCNVGNKATHVASLLRREGFTRVHSLLGGMMAWRGAGFPVE